MLFYTIHLIFLVNFIYGIEQNSTRCYSNEIINERCLVDCLSSESFISDHLIPFKTYQISLYFKTKSVLGYDLNSEYFKGNYSRFIIDKISWQHNCIKKIEKNFLRNLFTNDESKIKLFWSLTVSNSHCLYELNDFTFQPITHLKFLDLSFNQLRRISHNAFSGLDILEILNLNNNNLIYINNKLFSSLKSLKFLELSGNSIVHIEHSAFRFLTRLKLLKLNRNNITVLESQIFGYFENLETLDLSFNKLESFNSDLMSSLCRESIRNLYLNDNRLRTLSSNIIDFTNMNPSHVDINLSNNQWNCDNKLFWMKSCLEYIRTESIKCHTPSKFKDFTLNQIPDRFLRQTQSSSATGSVNELSLKDEIIGVIVSVCSVILILGVLFLGYRYRWCKYVKICKFAKKKFKLVERNSDDNTQLYMIMKEGDKV